MPGPGRRSRIVNQIYRWFIDDGLVESEIAGRLKPWGPHRPGSRLDARHRARGADQRKVHRQQRLQPTLLQAQEAAGGEQQPEMWIKKEGAFEASCRRSVLHRAGHHPCKAHRFSNEELIEKLRGLYQHHGFLSGLIIDETEGMPSARSTRTASAA
jgi:hypothetical protein